MRGRSSLWRRRVLAAAAMALAVSICIPTGSSQEDSDDGPRVGAGDIERRAWLEAAIDRAIDGHAILANARIGIAVKDLGSGVMLYRKNASDTYNVASNTKLVTTAAALALLGPDFRFRTTVAAEEIDKKGRIEGDLYIRSHADPLLTTWDLHQLAEELAVTGVTRVRGSLVVDSSYFDGDNLPPHFDEQPDEQAGFRAPAAATSLNFNTIAILVTPNPAGIGPAKVIVEPRNSYVKIKARVSTVSSGRTRMRVESRAKKDHLEVEVRGQIRREITKKRYRLRVPDPERYLGTAFMALLEDRGIRVAGKSIEKGKTPDRARVLATRESPALAEVVRALGKYSNNYVAEMLLKTIGAESLGSAERPATWDDGLAAVRSFLEEIAYWKGEFYYGNGSGLFESNRFSPEQIVTLLDVVYRDFRIGPDFVSSLSISGADGTLRRRMIDGPAERVVRAKTGTLDHVSALGGYVAFDGRAPVAFAVFVNDVPRWRTSDARSLQDAVATAIALYLRRGQ